MATHGRFHEPCPLCGAKIQRIRYASNETNYCPNCQTGGKLLADRSLSLLLKKDWPRTPEEFEEKVKRKKAAKHRVLAFLLLPFYFFLDSSRSQKMIVAADSIQHILNRKRGQN